MLINAHWIQDRTHQLLAVNPHTDQAEMQIGGAISSLEQARSNLTGNRTEIDFEPGCAEVCQRYDEVDEVARSIIVGCAYHADPDTIVIDRNHERQRIDEAVEDLRKAIHEHLTRLDTSA